MKPAYRIIPVSKDLRLLGVVVSKNAVGDYGLPHISLQPDPLFDLLCTADDRGMRDLGAIQYPLVRCPSVRRIHIFSVYAGLYNNFVTRQGDPGSLTDRMEGMTLCAVPSSFSCRYVYSHRPYPFEKALVFFSGNNCQFNPSDERKRPNVV